MKLELTDAQRELLEPMFQAVRDANKLGAEVAIFAQVWPDGFVAMTANPLEVGAIRAAFGHTGTGERLSAQHWVEAQDEKAALARLGAYRREGMDRLLRRARRRYFDNNPPNTWMATVFNELLEANGTFEKDHEANAKREAAANGDAAPGNRWWIAPCDRGQCPGPQSADCCHKPHPDDWMHQPGA